MPLPGQLYCWGGLKVVRDHPGTESSLWETQGTLDPSPGLILCAKRESV